MLQRHEGRSREYDHRDGGDRGPDDLQLHVLVKRGRRNTRPGAEPDHRDEKDQLGKQEEEHRHADGFPEELPDLVGNRCHGMEEPGVRGAGGGERRQQARKR